MSDISDESRKLFEALPVEGKISGSKIKERTGLSTSAYTEAKKELKALKLVELGRGRGGTISRAEGAELPAAPEAKSKDEILEVAREVKKELTRAQKAHEKTKEAVLAAGQRLFPDADKLVVGLYQKDWYVEVWKDNSAVAEYIPEHEWSDE